MIEMTNSPGIAPKSKGIPSKKSLWFEYEKLPLPTTTRWEAEDVLKLVFPPIAQQAQFEIAAKLLRFLSERIEIDGDELAEWAKTNAIPNSTLRNLVIPKLIRVGMLSRERRYPTGITEKDKRHPMVLKLSTKFGEALQHIGKEWNAVIETWKYKNKEK